MVGKDFDEIMSFHQKRREHILKGFVDYNKGSLITFEQLTEQVGSENVYTFEILKGYTDNLIEKGTESERLDFKNTLNSLVCIPVEKDGKSIDVFVEKGHMDFAGSGFDGSSRGLVKKQITDKIGRQTTKWVKKDSPEAKDDNPGNTDNTKEDRDVTGTKSPEDRGVTGTKSPEDWVKETSDEDLKKFVDTADDSEIDLIELAEQELRDRGVTGTGAEGSEDDFDEDELDSEVDYNNPDSVKFALDSHPDKDAIIDMAIDMGISIGQAMKVHDSNQQDHSETHAAIDQAQESLNALKEKTGHPEIKEGSNSMVSEELHDKLLQMIGDISVNNSKNKKLKQEAIDEVYDSMSGGEVDYEKVISIIEDYAANDRGATIKQESIENLIDEYYSETSEDHDDSGEELNSLKNKLKELENINSKEAYEQSNQIRDRIAYIEAKKLHDDEDDSEEEEYEETGHPETSEDDEFDSTEYAVMRYGDDILDESFDKMSSEDVAEAVGDFVMTLAEVAQFTPGITKQANDVFKKIESTIGKDEFLEIIENEISDEELLGNLELMYDEANSGVVLKKNNSSK